MKKLLLFCIIFSMMILNSYGDGPENIYIVDFSYDNGAIQIVDVQRSIGYYPDRIIQPSSGFKFSMISDEQIYSFMIPDPSIMFTDVSVNGSLNGGIEFFNKTQFTLVVPSIPKAEEIIISKNDEVILEYAIVNEEIIEKKIIYRLLFTIIIILILIILIGLYYKKRKERI